MKFVFVALMLFLTSCSSLSERKSEVVISFESVQRLTSTSHTKSDVEALFGSPVSKKLENNEEVWRYQSSEGFQLLNLYFDPKTAELAGALLLPQEQTGDLKRNDIEAAIPNSRFIANRIPDPPGSDSISNDYRYVDENRGVSFTTHGRERVEAINWSNLNRQRSPAQKAD